MKVDKTKAPPGWRVGNGRACGHGQWAFLVTDQNGVCQADITVQSQGGRAESRVEAVERAWAIKEAIDEQKKREDAERYKKDTEFYSRLAKKDK